jgi:hypothetical protein
MKLRDHPGLKIVSTPSWPPVWVHSRTEKVYGEVGTFTGTKINDAISTAIFLTMEFEQKHYMGFLSMNDAVFCGQLNKLLNEHVGQSVEEIGDLDVSFLL